MFGGSMSPSGGNGLLTYLNDTALQVWTGGRWETVTPEKQSALFSALATLPLLRRRR